MQFKRIARKYQFIMMRSLYKLMYTLIFIRRLDVHIENTTIRQIRIHSRIEQMWDF